VNARRRRLPALAAATWAVAAAGAAQAESAPDAGARAFQKCYACHSVDPAERGLPGPNLYHVIGRPAAALDDYEYSPAMIAAGRTGKLVWTETTLDRFLANPQAFLPGTAMNFFGLRNAAERQAVIGFLARGRP
jgi:cytochrome c